MRSTFICLNCRGEFSRHASAKNQKYCSSNECRRASRRAWKNKKRATNSSYRQDCQNHQKKWRKNRPAHEYQKQYRKSHPEYERRNRELQLERNKKRQKRQDAMIVKRNTLSTEPIVDKAFGGTYALMQVKSGKIVKRNTLMVRMQVLSGEAMILTQNSV
jgi:acetyl/propionyl-CoA carboxylase alpha subunit